MLYSNVQTQNQFLGALHTKAIDRLLPHLQEVCFPAGQILHDADELIDTVYFPIDTLVSLEYIMEDGFSAGAALVGKEGFVGMSRIMNRGTSANRAVVITSGHFYQLSGRVFEDEFKRSPELIDVLLRYTHTVLHQMGVTAACNRHHTILQQLSRWLLLSIDCLSVDELLITQERIANVLGVRREGITDAVGSLGKNGIIEHRRGRIRVLNRRKLVKSSCECYDSIRLRSDELNCPPGD